MLKIYKVREKIGKKEKRELEIDDDLITQCLWNRGVKTKKEAEKFLEPDFERDLHDPFLLPDMEKAVERVLKALEKNEKIGIWSDYDADGIPGGALLHDFFKQIGFNNFVNYIPDRHLEGYGLNTEGMEKLKEEKIKLLITVDCGIRDFEPIEQAKKSKIDVIVTDHHEVSDKLPDAFSVINPKRIDSKYPEKILCGSGVVWKLIQAILKIERLKEGKIKIKEGQEKWLLDLVGLATLSDMVPLTGENRALAYYGLKVLRKTKRPGLRRLYSMLRLKPENLTEDDIAFLITPRVNAASRMGRSKDAFDLLVAENFEQAEAIARHLDQINNERKGVVAALVKEIKKIVRERFFAAGERSVIALGNPEWRPALLGLCANSIAEEFRRPVFLWGRAEGVIKGSCRSDGSTDLVALMERTNNFFTEFGGHKLSGGFSIEFEKVHTLEEVLVEASTHVIKDGEEEILADAELNINNVNQETVSKIERLAPFGAGNEKPLFIFRDIIPEKISRFGKAEEHLSVLLRDGSHTARAISFFTAPDKFGDHLKTGLKTNLAANLEKSYFNTSSEIRLRIVDFF